MGDPQTSVSAAATSATIRRGQSGVRLRAISTTACATTATAASLSPRAQPASARSIDVVTSPNTSKAMADGKVNPIQAANPPARPARRVPIAMPSWLLAGPGRSWQSATRSPNAASSSQRRRSTYSRRK
jgi:hypothetical protein